MCKYANRSAFSLRNVLPQFNIELMSPVWPMFTGDTGRGKKKSITLCFLFKNKGAFYSIHSLIHYVGWRVWAAGLTVDRCQVITGLTCHSPLNLACVSSDCGRKEPHRSSSEILGMFLHKLIWLIMHLYLACLAVSTPLAKQPAIQEHVSLSLASVYLTFSSGLGWARGQNNP